MKTIANLRSGVSVERSHLGPRWGVLPRRRYDGDHVKVSTPWRVLLQPVFLSLLAGLLAFGSGCAGGKKEQKKDEFFTSGSREADQRASQKMAQAEQLSGEGEGGGE